LTREVKCGWLAFEESHINGDETRLILKGIVDFNIESLQIFEIISSDVRGGESLSYVWNHLMKVTIFHLNIDRLFLYKP
jgi:hypothetical protein